MSVRLKLLLSKRSARLHWGGWLAALAVTVFLILPIKSDWPNDFYGFWIVGQTPHSVFGDNIYAYRSQVGVAESARRGAENAPTRAEKGLRKSQAVMDLTASPFQYAVFAAVARGHLMDDYAVFHLVSTFLYVGAIVLFAGYLRYPPWSYPLLAFVLTVPFWPYRRDVMDANNSAALAGAAMLAFLLLRNPESRQRFFAGAALGILTAFKPTIAYGVATIVILLALTDRKALPPLAAGGAAGLLSSVVFSWVTLGRAVPWLKWLEHAPKRAFEVRDVAGGLIGRAFDVRSETPYHAVLVLLLAASAAWMWFAARETYRLPGWENRLVPKRFDTIAAGAAGLNCYLLCGVLVWGHYFTLAVPSILIALRPRPHRKDGGWIAWSIGLFASAMVAFHQFFRQWEWTSWGNYSPITIAGTAVLFGLVLWDLRDHRRSARTSFSL